MMGLWGMTKDKFFVACILWGIKTAPGIPELSGFLYVMAESLT